MLDYKQIQLAREATGIPDSTLEKDYLIELLLCHFSMSDYLKEHFVFRGGTALKKVYFPHFRYSEDIDFITDIRVGMNNCEEIIGKTLALINKTLPVDLHMESMPMQKGHVQILINYRLLPEIHGDKKLKIDIVNDVPLLKASPRRLAFTHKDFSGMKRTIRTYHLESILAEKIGRILDVVNEPRDLWDLLFLLRLKSRIKTKEVKSSFRKKYITGINVPNLISAIENSDYKNNWETRLRNQVPSLMPYSAAIKELTGLVKKAFSQ
jgi:predicted nucleotidyltransferase component of viral defense system